MGDGEGPVRPLSQEVLAELSVARGILPLCGLRLDRPICKRVYCSDASDKGYALHVTMATMEEAWEAARFRERWRFKEAEGVAVGRDRSLVLQGGRAPLLSPTPARDTIAISPGGQPPAWRRRRLDWRAGRLSGRVIQPPHCPCGRHDRSRCGTRTWWRSWVPFPASRRSGLILLGGSAWLPAPGAGRARSIARTPCRAALLGLHRDASDPAAHGAVVLSFGDNLAETLVYDRGRAKEWALLALVRKSNAFQLGTDLRWARRYIETKRNPSDADSHIADRGGLAPG